MQIIPHENYNINMSILFETEDLIPLSQFAPIFGIWLSNVDRVEAVDNHDIMRYYGQKLTASEAVFCGSYARHVIFGVKAPNLEEGAFECSPMYRQAFLEKIVREKLKMDNYIFPLLIKIQ